MLNNSIHGTKRKRKKTKWSLAELVFFLFFVLIFFILTVEMIYAFKEVKYKFYGVLTVIELKNGNDLAKDLNIKEIYFDFEKWDIRPDAEVELQKVLAVLEKIPSMKIEMRAHSDCQGSDKYNMLLSNKRAESIINYFVTKGVSRHRISGKGYGEPQLLKDCKNAVECSAEDHQLNRRCEFIITSTGESIKYCY